MKAVYYNDTDPFCCAWLRELIKSGLISDGEVDERSIVDVQPGDLTGFRQCHFFAGIGGWAYALRIAGWPEDREVWTGSCPCQPLSCAGQRKGHADERHLWPAFYRLIAECKPATVFGEQVASKDGREWLAGIRTDLEGVGYAVGAADLCAASVGAPHRRQRLFWLADAQLDARRADESRRKPQGRAVNGSDCADVRLANPGRERDERRGEHRDLAGTGGNSQGEARQRERGGDADCDSVTDGRLANAELARRKAAWSGSSLDARGQSEPGCVRGGGVDHSASARLDGAGCGSEGEARNEARLRGPQCGCGEHGGMGDSEANGYEMRPQLHGELRRQGLGEGCFWSDAIWIPTRDPRTGEAKMRRISPKPEVFPLAARLPGRVGMLRGAGNSIVPQVAAEFVKAFLEA